MGVNDRIRFLRLCSALDEVLESATAAAYLVEQKHTIA